MLVEDDGWEKEEVEPVEDDMDDAISDLDSEHADEQSNFSDQLDVLNALFYYLMQWTCSLSFSLVNATLM